VTHQNGAALSCPTTKHNHNVARIDPRRNCERGRYRRQPGKNEGTANPVNCNRGNQQSGTTSARDVSVSQARNAPRGSPQNCSKNRQTKKIGAPGTIRTSDPQIRSLMLYPAELRARRRRFPSRMVALAQARCDIRGPALRHRVMKTHVFPMICFVAAACSTPANPPSLLPRAIETRPEAAAQPPSIVLSKGITPALAAKVNALLVEAKAGDADFVTTEVTGNSAVAAGRGALQGSEAWIAAELVRSALQVARQRSAGALAEIDTLAINQGELASRDATVGGLAEIIAAQTEIEAIVARQTARLEALNR
jgi:hypothetical protein